MTELESDNKYLLEDFLFELTEIQSSDVLVNIDFSKKAVFQLDSINSEQSIPIDGTLHAILKVAVQHKRQTDTDTLCLAFEAIQWNYKGKNVVSPLWLIPITWRINKVKNSLDFTTDLDGAILNPFVKNALKRRFDLNWKELDVTDISQNLIYFKEFIADYGIEAEIISVCALGNFHHHRYQIVKDLEALQAVELNPLVNELLGNDVGLRTQEEIVLTTQNIVASDKDQAQVFEKMKRGNLVIQGPPGTGKSQVLTNVLAKLLDHGKMNLVVSEKKSALEVLEKKLSSQGLDAFTFIAHNQTKSADFIAKLKKTWQQLEIFQGQFAVNLLLSEQRMAQLQLKLDTLASKDLIGGIDLATFKKLMGGKDYLQTDYTSAVPSISVWQKEKVHVEEIASSVSTFEIFKHFKQNSFGEILSLDRRLQQLAIEFETLTKALEIQRFDEIETRLNQFARAQILENESYKKYKQLFSSAKTRKTFEKLRQNYLLQQLISPLEELEIKLWETLPSLSEVESWEVQLKGTWWKKRQAQRQISAMLLSKSIQPEIAVQNIIAVLRKQLELSKTTQLLREFGIERPAVELESVRYVLQQLNDVDANELNSVAKLSSVLKDSLIKSGKNLERCFRESKELLTFAGEDNILDTILSALKAIPEILIVQQNVKYLSNFTYKLLQKYNSANEIEDVIVYSNWKQFSALFPELAVFDGNILVETIEAILTAQQEEQNIFGRNLFLQQQQKFNQFHTLLRTPAAKLTSAQKITKAQLKIGKAILVKEFGKTKQHKTIRELLDSEARIWIEVLTPIWLSTPAKVAANFPMEENLFQYVIFDEASQIPLSHALGALQRANRAMVAGDEQQMSPGSYFSATTTGVDLLHQANYYWQKSPLKHHYRSIHPELIAFSNRFFYNNELIVYPAAERKIKPIQQHFVANGIFEERQNSVEAKAISPKIESLIFENGTLGIVAFSEQQLECIWKQLPANVQDELGNRVEAGTAFFKTLEQVQGDECDHLLIGFGYGRNPENIFHHKFGPLNQKNGTKRLNVLFSRAIKSIDFFTSIEAKDLTLSSNEAINLLRQFMLQNPISDQAANNETAANQIIFPHNLKPTISGKKLNFEHIETKLPDAAELVVMYALLKQRGWEVGF